MVVVTEFIVVAQSLIQHISSLLLTVFIQRLVNMLFITIGIAVGELVALFLTEYPYWNHCHLLVDCNSYARMVSQKLNLKNGGDDNILKPSNFGTRKFDVFEISTVLVTSVSNEKCIFEVYLHTFIKDGLINFSHYALGCSIWVCTASLKNKRSLFFS